MLITKEGQEQKRRPLPAWLCLLMTPLILPVVFLVMAYNQPLDFQLGSTSALVMVTRNAGMPNPGNPYQQLDVPGIQNWDYPVNSHLYRLNGTGHIRGIWIGEWQFEVGWCRGRRVK